jgi:drug/metabolite transporter (DMT)-like permease
MTRFPGPPLWTILLGLPFGALVVAIGAALVARATTPVGTGWAALFLLLGAILLVADVALLRARSDPGRDPRRGTGLVVLGVLGAWALAMAVAAMVQGTHPVWPVVALGLAAYLWGSAVVAVRRQRGVTPPRP